MIYVFVCVSEKCIGTKTAVRCYSCLVPHENELGVAFAKDSKEYNEIYQKTNNQLRALGYQIPAKQGQEKLAEESKQGGADSQIDSSSTQATSKRTFDRFPDGDDDGWKDVNHEDDNDDDEFGKKKAAAYIHNVKRIEKALQQKKIVFQKEYLIDSDIEVASITRFYCKQSYKILKELYGAQAVIQAAARQRMQIADQSDSDLDDDGELVGQMFGV